MFLWSECPAYYVEICPLVEVTCSEAFILGRGNKIQVPGYVSQLERDRGREGKEGNGWEEEGKEKRKGGGGGGGGRGGEERGRRGEAEEGREKRGGRRGKGERGGRRGEGEEGEQEVRGVEKEEIWSQKLALLHDVAHLMFFVPPLHRGKTQHHTVTTSTLAT